MNSDATSFNKSSPSSPIISHQQTMFPFPKPLILSLFCLLAVSSSLLSLFFLNPTTTTMTTKTALIPPNPNLSSYHDWDHFAADYLQMKLRLKLYAYPELNSIDSSLPFARIFLPLRNPYDPKLGNYFSEHMFKISLLRSPLLSHHPTSADFFFLPFSVNALRNDPRVRTEAAISAFVAGYVGNVSLGYGFWNASSGVDHFYVHCHSVGRDAASRHFELLNNAVQVACSASYFQRLYVSHKDVALPQVWPRKEERVLIPPSERQRLIFFSGRVQNSIIRRELMDTWENDEDMDIFSGNPPFSYEEGFRRSKYCLHVKGYEVNTARISDALHHGCIPVVLSNYYDLPFANVLDWSKFSIIVNHRDIKSLKEVLLSVPAEAYEDMFKNLCQVRRHFVWHETPRDFDAFYMTAYQLWLRRGVHHLSR